MKIANYGILNSTNFTPGELRCSRNMGTISEIMGVYLDYFGIQPSGRQVVFFEKMWSRLLDKAIDEAQRVVLPHNLGYIQVLAYALGNSIKGDRMEHIKKFGFVDYGLVWIKHPMYIYHTFVFDSEIDRRIKENVLKGKVYLTDYVDGDTYVT